MNERDRLTVVLLVVLTAIIAFLAGLALATPAESRELTAREYLTHRVNTLRSEHDRDRLPWDNRLVEGATDAAERLTYDFSHTTTFDETIGVSRWVLVGEAIGRAYDVEQVWKLILRSDAHRSMLLRPRWDRIGVGVARAPLNDRAGLYVAIWVYDEGK